MATVWWDHDQLLVVLSFLGLAVVAVLLVRGERDRAVAPASIVAHVAHAGPGVLVQPSGSLVWDEAGTGSHLSAHDALFVPAGSSASVRFASGADFDVVERSLVVIEPPAGEPSGVSVLQGSVEASTGVAPASVRGAAGVAVLEPGAAGTFRARAAPAGGWFELGSGAARVQGERRDAPRRAVHLDAPARGRRFYAATFPTVVPLRWSGARAGARVQVAADAGFARPIAAAAAEGGALDLAVGGPGAFRFRVVEGDPPRAQSEERRFVVIADVPPTPVAPVPGEVVMAPPGAEVPFLWTGVEGVSRYRVEVAADPSFAEVELSREAEGTALWIDPGIPEGVHHWRVRSVDPERGASPPSEPTPFRLITAAIPGAPQLLDPTLEVEDGAAR